MGDEILEEVWRNRDEFARRHNYDLDAMVAEIRKMERHPLNTLINWEKKTATKRRRPDAASRRR
ncbi:MAG: hypothetical protein ACMUIS_02260 [bacterium]